MSTISIADILELPVQDRIRLVELIRDIVAALPETIFRVISKTTISRFFTLSRQIHQKQSSTKPI